MIYQDVITPQQLKAKIDEKAEVFIVDMRERIGFFKPIDPSVHLPASQILQKLAGLPKDKPVVLYCWHGVDSFFLMNLLKTEYGFSDIYSLKSGIEGWHKYLDGPQKG